MATPLKPPPQSIAEKGSGTRYLVAAPVLVIGILVIGYFAVLRGQIRTFHELRARQNVERVSDGAREQIDRITRVEQEIAKIPEQDRQIIDRMVPAGEEVPGLFAIFDAAAQRAGVAVTSMDVTREASKDLKISGGARMLAANLAIRNVDYPKLKAFLGVLASSQRLLDVLTVQFSPQGRNASVLVRAYTLD